MSEEKKTAMDALGGVAPQDGGDTTDWKAKFEEAQHALESAKVEQGRVKTLDAKVKELERQLAERTVRRPSDYLSAEERETIDAEQRGAIDKMVEGRVADAIAASREEMEAMKATIARQNAERETRERELRKRELDERFEREFPGLVSQIGPGGDKHDAWNDYRRYNGPAIDSALAGFDFDALKWHIERFFTDTLGLPPPSGGKAPAAPEPGNIGGGKPVFQHAGKQYTDAEIDELFDKKEAARDRGDWSEVKRLTDEINRAQASGGAKQQ